MAPPKYKDLGKAAKDILDEDFKFEQTFELKSKLNGIDLKSTFSDKGKGLAGNLEVDQRRCVRNGCVYANGLTAINPFPLDFRQLY